MTDELKPVRCGCGGEAKVDYVIQHDGLYMAGVFCANCGTKTIPFWSKEKDKAIDYAVTTWNMAMSGSTDLGGRRMTGGSWYAGRTKNDEREAVTHLDRFCKSFCIDVEVTDDLEFRCKDCTFQTESGHCLVKMFKSIYAPDYKEFGSMGDL